MAVTNTIESFKTAEDDLILELEQIQQ